jgi:hypothetical protein
VKRLTKISPFFKHCGSTSLPRIAAYVFCFMSGASVRFSRHLAGIHHNATVTRLNTAMSAMCVAENFRQFVEKDKDNWAEIQADESAAGKRKYHRGRRVRQGGIVWMAGAAKIHKGLVEKLIVRVVERRRAENLLPMLVDLVQQDGVLTTDCWRAYGGFAAEATKKAEGELQKLSETATPELKVRWSRCGTNDPTQQDNRVQFGVWVINHRLGSAETGIFQAMMVLLMNYDMSKPPPGTFDVAMVPQKDREEFEENVDPDDEEANVSWDGDSDNDDAATDTAEESDEEPPVANLHMVERGFYRSQRQHKAAEAAKRRDANKAKREARQEGVKKRKEENAARKAANEERLVAWRQEKARKAAAKAELAQAQEALKEARKRLREEKRNAGRTPRPAQDAPAPAQEGE